MVAMTTDLTTRLGEAGLRLNPTKTAISGWLPRHGGLTEEAEAALAAAGLPHPGPGVNQGIVVLGMPIGTGTFVPQQLSVMRAAMERGLNLLVAGSQQATHDGKHSRAAGDTAGASAARRAACPLHLHPASLRHDGAAPCAVPVGPVTTWGAWREGIASGFGLWHLRRQSFHSCC